LVHCAPKDWRGGFEAAAPKEWHSFFFLFRAPKEKGKEEGRRRGRMASTSLASLLLLAASTAVLAAGCLGIPAAASVAGARCRLRGGGVFGGLDDSKVTADEIREIGADVLKMWEVSHTETAEDGADVDKIGAPGKASMRGSSSGELARPPGSLRGTELSRDQPDAAAPREAEGPEKESVNEQTCATQGEHTYDILPAPMTPSYVLGVDWHATIIL